ncbi:MAG: alanine racemase [Myxococcales bacterium]|nr:alanine racemase [Myxococcales bacterium]
MRTSHPQDQPPSSVSKPLPAEPAPLTWVEISQGALQNNVNLLRQASGGSNASPRVCVMVKGNAYGHGLVPAAQTFVSAGADWLGIADVFEARDLRAAGITVPLFAVCHIAPEQMDFAVACDVRLTVYDDATVLAAAAAAQRLGVVAKLHVKLETGTNRQGLLHDAALALCELIVTTDGVTLEGISTHFADIEDTTNHRFAKLQLRRFTDGLAAVRALIARFGGDPASLLAHASNTAALLLWPEVGLDLVRCGIGAYGLWPSKETFLSAQQLGKSPIGLKAALTWKTRIAQVKDVPAGEWVGYGRTFRTLRATRLAILPIGYYDGYDRRLSGVAQVLVGGQRAPVVGRVAMNMIAIDVTDNRATAAGDEVVLLGAQASEKASDEISAGEMAGWMGTIHYEVVTRIHERIARRVVP